jgi:hypothetical protein
MYRNIRIMNLPIILINFKSYKEATGDRALCLAKICEELSTRYKTTIAVVPQYIDINNHWLKPVVFINLLSLASYVCAYVFWILSYGIEVYNRRP